ncbi:MAG TPA: hypothetical protein VFQ30_01965 [Ktedonobacteraceae bacterium]|nr:hypothetical protein [Ktedonobacteraceae bacterium]
MIVLIAGLILASAGFAVAVRRILRRVVRWQQGEAEVQENAAL